MQGYLQQTRSAHQQTRRRRASSYLEVQVAMVMLVIGMGGLYSMVVVQTRQGNRLREFLPATQVAAINQADTVWARKLGVYASIDDAVVASEPVLPDPSFELVVDDQGPASSMTFFHAPADTFGWTPWNYGAAYLDNCRYHYSVGNVGSWAQFNASGLPPGDYEVLTTYSALGSLGSAIPYEMYDGTTLRGTVIVDQTQLTTEVDYNGQMFDSLGVFTVNSGDLHVRLLDGPGSANYVLFDAILIRSRRPLDVVSLQPTANDGAQVVVEATSF